MSVEQDVRYFMRVAGQETPTVPQTVELDDRTEAFLAHAVPEGFRLVWDYMGELQQRPPETPGGKLALLRARLMLEELAETLFALSKGDMVELADGLADIVYVTVGTAVAYGIPFDRVFAEVQRSNMAKTVPCPKCPPLIHDARCPECGGRGRVMLRDAGGKVVKPPGWTPPDVAGVLTGAVNPPKMAPAASPGDEVRFLRAALVEIADMNHGTTENKAITLAQNALGALRLVP